MKTFFLFGHRAGLAALLLAGSLITACDQVQKELAHEHQHQAAHKPTPQSTAIRRRGPHKGKVVQALKVYWELAGGAQTRLYLLDAELKALPLKPIEAEVALEKPAGQQISKFTHVKDHLEAKVAYDPAKDKAVVMMTVKGKTEMIDFSK